MKTNKLLINDFTIGELENRFEMKTWVATHPPGELDS